MTDQKKMGTCDLESSKHLGIHVWTTACWRFQSAPLEAPEQPRQAEQFAKSWEGFKGEPSKITDGKTLDPLAPWQIAVAVRFAEAYAAFRLSSALELAKRNLAEYRGRFSTPTNMTAGGDWLEIVKALEGK